MPKQLKGIDRSGITPGVLLPNDTNMTDLVKESPSYIEFTNQDSRTAFKSSTIAGTEDFMKQTDRVNV